MGFCQYMTTKLILLPSWTPSASCSWTLQVSPLWHHRSVLLGHCVTWGYFASKRLGAFDSKWPFVSSSLEERTGVLSAPPNLILEGTADSKKWIQAPSQGCFPLTLHYFRPLFSLSLNKRSKQVWCYLRKVLDLHQRL